jgi:hypothetical protein
MATETRPTRFDVWIHERTGTYYVVDAGETAIGPFRPDQVLRHWRVASAPSEPVLAMPNYYEHYARRPLPFPTSEWTELDPETLPPSVTFHEIPDGPFDVEWFSPTPEVRNEVLALANASEWWIDRSAANFGRLDKRALYWGHPAGSVLVCLKAVPGQRVAVIDWPPPF